MSERTQTSRITFASSDIVKIERYGETTMPSLGWLLSAAPAIVCFMSLWVVIVQRHWALAICFGFILAAVLSFILSVVIIYFKSRCRFTLTRHGITRERVSLTGRKYDKIDIDRITGLRATVQGYSEVRLAAETSDRGSITLLTAPVENFTDAARSVSWVLQRPYVVAFFCPLGCEDGVRAESLNADFINIDPWHRRVVIEKIDETSVSIPFEDIVSVGVAGQAGITHSANPQETHFEYIYHPVLEFADGSTQKLQRFRSTEPLSTKHSEALLNARKFADYLQSCLLYGDRATERAHAHAGLDACQSGEST